MISACYNNFAAVVELLKLGANLNATDSQGRKAKTLAKYLGNNEIFKYLDHLEIANFIPK